MNQLKQYLNVYEFEEELPGTKQTVKYKGLTTNSMKQLMVHKDVDDPLEEEELLDKIINISLIDKVNIDDMYVSDRYFLFIKIREATKGKYFKFQHECKKCKSQSLQSIDINELIINKPENIDKQIKVLQDKIEFDMDFPLRKTQKIIFNTIDKKLSSEEKRIELGLADIASHITKIKTPEGEMEINYKELIDFIGDLPEQELDVFNNWREENGFSLKLVHNIKCRSCGEEEDIQLPLSDFFS